MELALGISALLVAIAALIVGFMAQSRAGELAEETRRLKNEFTEFSTSLRQKLEVLAKKISSAPPPTPPTSRQPAPPAPPQRQAPKSAPAASPPPPPPPPAPPPPQVINFDCIHCEQNIDAPPEMAGLWVACPTCKQAIQVPGTATAKAGVAEIPPEDAVPESGAAIEGDEEPATKGQTVRIDLSQMFAEMEQRPKRQIVIKRRT